MKPLTDGINRLTDTDANHTALPFVNFDLTNLIEEQGKILEMIAGGSELSEILNAIIFWVQNECKEELLASILLMDAEKKHLLHGAAPSLPMEYNAALDGIAIGPGVGSCGTAAFRKQKVIVTDIESDPLWKDHKDLALRFGLKACWSTPLIARDQSVLGTFAMYYKHPKKPSVHDLQIIRLISNTAILALESNRAEQERQQLLASERKAHLAILQERRRFLHLLMNAPAMICILRGPEHVYELANPLYMEAIGTEREVLGKPIEEALPELKGQGIIELLDKVYQTGEPFYGNEILVQLKRRDILEDRYFNFVYQSVTGDDGVAEGIFVHAVDVTELVKAKHKAQENEEMFRSFVLNSPTPIGIYTGKEMRIQTANEAILKAWEKDHSVIGKTLREALPELEGQPFHQLLEQVYSTGVPYHGAEDQVYLMRNGVLTTTYWNFTYKALRNEKEEVYGVINTATEVTELVMAKKRLVEAQEALQSAIDIAQLGTWTIDLRENFVSYSQPVCDWFGLPPGGTSLESAFDSVCEEDRKRIREAVIQAGTTTGTYEAEYKVVHPNTKEERLIQARGSVLYDEKATPVLVKGVCRDITLQKQIELELAREVEKRTLALHTANQELNALNENLRQFIYIASHDLQEPLRKINMFADMLKKESEFPQDSRGLYFLDKIGNAASRMTNLIKDLLNYSRVESGEKRFLATDLNVVLKNVLDDYEMLILQKEASINVEQLPTLQAIPHQMNQLFYNLIGNALKFSRTGVPPTILVKCKMLAEEAVRENDMLHSGRHYVELVVEDNGIGFNQRFADQMFEIFQRLHPCSAI